MPPTQQISVTLPDDIADQVRAKVASGRYASESEVVREGLRVLDDRDGTLERWLLDEVVPAYDAYKADPSQARTIEDVRATLAARYERAVARR